MFISSNFEVLHRCLQPYVPTTSPLLSGLEKKLQKKNYPPLPPKDNEIFSLAVYL